MLGFRVPMCDERAFDALLFALVTLDPFGSVVGLLVLLKFAMCVVLLRAVWANIWLFTQMLSDVWVQCGLRVESHWTLRALEGWLTMPTAMI